MYYALTGFHVPQVLLIDDSPTQLHMRQAVLQEAGFSVAGATTAELALQMLNDPQASAGLGVIVTDHVMPEVSGDAFVRRLRRVSALPVIVISGLVEAEEEYCGLQVTFLHKPCPPQDLIRHVRMALNPAG